MLVCVLYICVIQVFCDPMNFQYHQQSKKRQPMKQPQVTIEIDDPATDNVTPGSGPSDDQLMSGERITFQADDQKREFAAYMKVKKAQLQLFIALCKASIMKPHYSTDGLT